MRSSVVPALAVVAGALASGSAGASFATNATVADIFIGPTVANVVFIKVNPVPTGQPSCSTNINYHYALSLSGTAANQMYAALLAAMMAGKLVGFSGLGTCTSYATVEDLRSISVTQ